jgi:nucleoid-associated protein EbfC
VGSGFSKQKKQARAMQDQLQKLQQQMAETVVEGQAGNGLVKVKLSGEQELQAITISPECVDPEDVEALQDLILAAVKDASDKIEDQSPLKGLPGFTGF